MHDKGEAVLSAFSWKPGCHIVACTLSTIKGIVGCGFVGVTCRGGLLSPLTRYNVLIRLIVGCWFWKGFFPHSLFQSQFSFKTTFSVFLGIKTRASLRWCSNYRFMLWPPVSIISTCFLRKSCFVHHLGTEEGSKHHTGCYSHPKLTQNSKVRPHLKRILASHLCVTSLGIEHLCVMHYAFLPYSLSNAWLTWNRQLSFRHKNFLVRFRNRLLTPGFTRDTDPSLLTEGTVCGQLLLYVKVC